MVVIDEIGRMELLSADFREIVLRIVSSGKRVLGTIMFDAHPWADSLKRQPQVKVVKVTRANRPQILNDLRRWLSMTESR